MSKHNRSQRPGSQSRSRDAGARDGSRGDAPHGNRKGPLRGDHKGPRSDHKGGHKGGHKAGGRADFREAREDHRAPRADHRAPRDDHRAPRDDHRGARPDHKGASRPDYKGGSRPDHKGASRADHKGASRPDHKAGGRADHRAPPRAAREAAPRAEYKAPQPTRKTAVHPDHKIAPRAEPKAAFFAERKEAAVPAEEGRASKSSEVWLYGHHAVAAAVANPSRKIMRLMGTTEALAKLTEEVGELGQARTCSRKEIDAVVGTDAVHQGVAMLTRALDHNLSDVLELASAKPNACIMVLDQVTDPHNVGAILRSAAAFGAVAVLAPDRNAPDENGVMAKAASGALDKIAYVKTTNLVRALEEIKQHQFWVVGLDAGAKDSIGKIKLGGRIALVMGAEGEGVRRLVLENCDHVAHLPMAGDMESLNVSNAAAVALYEKVRQDAKG